MPWSLLKYSNISGYGRPVDRDKIVINSFLAQQFSILGAAALVQEYLDISEPVLGYKTTKTDDSTTSSFIARLFFSYHLWHLNYIPKKKILPHTSKYKLNNFHTFSLRGIASALFTVIQSFSQQRTMMPWRKHLCHQRGNKAGQLQFRRNNTKLSYEVRM